MAILDIEVADNVLISAEMLQQNFQQKEQLKAAILNIMRRIDAEIRNAFHTGEKHLITELPTIFDIGNLSNAAAQTAVWSNIIYSLEKKGYRVWITYTKANCFIKVTWVSEEEEMIKKAQRNIIQSRKCNGF